MPNERTIYRVCAYLRNWFDRNQYNYAGIIAIENGALKGTYGLKVGQYFRIVGSSLNDGVYLYPTTSLRDEVSSGAVWGMAIPPALLDVMEKIEAWETKYGDVSSAAMSPFTSESVSGVYSYSKNSGGNDTTRGKAGTWQGAFGAELQPWRKI